MIADLTPYPTMKDSGVPWLEEVQKHWEVRRVKHAFCRIVGGSTPSNAKAGCWHGVSEEIYEEIKHKVDVKSGDILLMRDGTYLIGTSAVVTEADRAKQFTQDIIDTLGKRFTEVLIPVVPRNKKVAEKIAREMQKIIKGRATLRNRAKAIALELQGQNVGTPEDIEELSEL